MNELRQFFYNYRLKLILQHYANISRENNILRGAIVLDVGSGAGEEAAILLKDNPRFLILLDEDVYPLKEAGANLSHFQNKAFLCADAERLPLKDKSVDFVILRDILHHLHDAHSGIKEGIRVSKKAIFIDEPARGRVRDLINLLLVALNKKDKYEIRKGVALKFRIDKKLLGKIREEEGAEIFYFPYLFYHFGLFDKVRHGFLVTLIKKLVVIFNAICPAKNRAMVVIVPGK